VSRIESFQSPSWRNDGRRDDWAFVRSGLALTGLAS
jgi:hypothetical protein